jgi:SRSO17 transposase
MAKAQKSRASKQAYIGQKQLVFFIEHSFKEQKQILGIDQFQTRKWLSWHHQVALNMLISCFMLKGK